MLGVRVNDSTKTQRGSVSWLFFCYLYHRDLAERVASDEVGRVTFFCSLRVSAIIVSDFARDMNGKNYKKIGFERETQNRFLFFDNRAGRDAVVSKHGYRIAVDPLTADHDGHGRRTTHGCRR